MAEAQRGAATGIESYRNLHSKRGPSPNVSKLLLALLPKEVSRSKEQVVGELVEQQHESAGCLRHVFEAPDGVH